MHVLEAAGFKLRKWTSNEHAIIQDVPVKDQNRNTIDFTSERQLKTLGTTWQAFSDKLTFTIRELIQTKVTKRQILAETAQIFDPLGLLSPCIITAKILLQELWLHRLAWDESLPFDLNSKWLSFRKQSQHLNQVKVSRHILCNNYTDVQIHGFADASQRAYGACTYM